LGELNLFSFHYGLLREERTKNKKSQKNTVEKKLSKDEVQL